MRRSCTAFALAFLCAPLPAAAWDNKLHVAIVEAARKVSPVLNTRLDETNLDAVLLSAGTEADLLEKTCVHRDPGWATEPWTVASEVLAKLRNPKVTLNARQRAQQVGRYLHFVADSATPIRATGKYRSAALSHDLAVFREPRRLVEPLAPALKERAAEVFALGEDPGALSRAFRDAVNLTIDAALLLPPLPGAHAVEDKGPVLLVGMVQLHQEAEAVALLHPGIHVLEWSARKTPEGSVVRAIVYNNLDFCVRHLLFWSRGFVGGVSASVPQGRLTQLEFQAPPSSPDDVLVRFIPGDCQTDPAAKTIPLDWRAVVMAPYGVPDLERAAEIRPGDPAPEPVGRTTYLEFMKTDMEAIGGLEFLSFQAIPGDGRIDFKIHVRNRSEKSPKPLFVQLQVGSFKKKTGEIREMKLDVSSLPVGGDKAFDGHIVAQTFGREDTAIRVYGIHRGDTGAATRPQPKKPIDW